MAPQYQEEFVKSHGGTMDNYIKMMEEGFLTAGKQLIKFLIGLNIAEVRDIHCRHMACHPENRDRFMINAHDMHKLLAGFSRMKWDGTLVDPVCTERDPEDVQSVRDNEAMVEASNHMLAPIVEAEVKGLSLTCGHTVQAHRACYFGMPCDDANLSIGGKLCLSRITEHDPGLAHAINHGMKWTVIPTWIMKLWPKLPALLQAMGNATGHLQAGEHDLQLFRKLFNAWLKEARKSGDGAVSFAVVKDEVLRSNPPNAQAVPQMYNFIVKYSGGMDAYTLGLMHWTETYVKFKAPSKVALSGLVYEALTSELKGSSPEEQAPEVRHGILKYMLSEGSARVGIADIKRVLSKDYSAQTLDASTHIVCVKKLIAKHVDPMPMSVMVAIGELEINMVLCLLGKKSLDSQKTYAKFGGVAYDCIMHIRELVGKPQIPCKWKQDNIQEPPCKPSNINPGSISMRTFNMDGKMANPEVLIKDKGFAKGNAIKDVKGETGDTGIIVDITSDCVIVKKQSGAVTNLHFDLFLNGNWQKHQTEEAATEVAWLHMSPTNSILWQIASLKATITSELAALSGRHSSCMADLKVFVKSSKSRVVASIDIPKNKLFLVPITTKVECKLSDDGPKIQQFYPYSSSAGAAVFLGTWDHKYAIYLSQLHVASPKKNEDGFVNPFWLVSPTDDPDEANMEMPKRATKFELGQKIPMLKNNRSIQAGETLKFLRMEPPAAKQPPAAKKREAAETNTGADKKARK
jgi:hypothetical protein